MTEEEIEPICIICKKKCMHCYKMLKLLDTETNKKEYINEEIIYNDCIFCNRKVKKNYFKNLENISIHKACYIKARYDKVDENDKIKVYNNLVNFVKFNTFKNEHKIDDIIDMHDKLINNFELQKQKTNDIYILDKLCQDYKNLLRIDMLINSNKKYLNEE